MKHIEPIDNSASLGYNKSKAFDDRQSAARHKEEADLDSVLKNIREILLNSTKKLKTVTPDLIDEIYRFENLNDFTKQADLEELLGEQLELMNQ